MVDEKKTKVVDMIKSQIKNFIANNKGVCNIPGIDIIDSQLVLDGDIIDLDLMQTNLSEKDFKFVIKWLATRLESVSILENILENEAYFM